MTQAARQKATYDDLKQAPPELVAEIIHGRLITRRMPAPRQSSATARLSALLSQDYGVKRRGFDRYVFIDKPELHLNGHVIVPSLAAWPVPIFRARIDRGWAEFSLPSWLAEVIPPDEAGYELETKQAIYARAGMEYIWTVRPHAKSLTVLQLGRDVWQPANVFQTGDLVCARPFDGIEFKLDHLWPLNPQEASSE